MQGAAFQSDWWRLFHDPKLDALITQALKANSDLAAARAALKSAHQTYLSEVSVLEPTVDASVGSSRNKSSEYLSPPLNAQTFYYGLQSAELDLNYTLDLFGGLRRQVEGAKAQEQAQRFQTEGVYLTLVSNVVVAAVQEASLRAQTAAQERIIAVESDILGVMQRQLDLGQIARSDLLLQQASLAQAQAALPPLQKQLAVEQDLLAYLIGRTPGQGDIVGIDLDSLTLPNDLPLGVPSDLVTQRPDIRVAEANLHAASAAVGVAIAARLPNLTLTGSLGGSGGKWSQVGTTPDSFWSYGAGVTQPIFEGGLLYRKQKASQAALIQAKELYRSAVLSAFQNVGDVLQSLVVDQRGLLAAETSESAAAASLSIARSQLNEGQVNGVTVLNAEQSLKQSEQALVQARAARYTDTAALFQALGGGWWRRSASDAS